MSTRAAGLIRYHLQNAEMAETDREALAALADVLDDASLDRSVAVWEFARAYARPSGDSEDCACVNCRAYRAVHEDD